MIISKRTAMFLGLLVTASLCSCDRMNTEMTSSCHEIEGSVDQETITWERAKSQASIGTVVIECLPLKDTSTYKIVATAKVTTTIDNTLFGIYGPLTDAIRFEALSAKGVVVGLEEASYGMPRLLRKENVSVTFKDLFPSEVRSITKIVAGWSYK